jgi:hypothetical protein
VSQVVFGTVRASEIASMPQKVRIITASPAINLIRVFIFAAKYKSQSEQ